MSWSVLILIGALLSGLRNIQSRRLGRFRKDFSAYALFASFVSVSMLGLLYGLVHHDNILLDSIPNYIWFLILGGVLFSLVNYITLQMFRAAPASAIVLLSLLNIVGVVVISALFASESLSTLQWLGATLLVSSAVFSKWLTTHKSKNSKITTRLFLAAIVVAILYGFATINEKFLLEQLNIPTYLIFGWGAQAIAATLIALRLGLRTQIKTTKKNHFNVWLLGLLLPMSGIFFILSLDVSKSASLTVIGSSLKVIVTLILAFIFLKEREKVLLKTICVLLAFSGFYLIS